MVKKSKYGVFVKHNLGGRVITVNYRRKEWGCILNIVSGILEHLANYASNCSSHDKNEQVLFVDIYNRARVLMQFSAAINKHLDAGGQFGGRKPEFRIRIKDEWIPVLGTTGAMQEQWEENAHYALLYNQIFEQCNIILTGIMNNWKAYDDNQDFMQAIAHFIKELIWLEWLIRVMRERKRNSTRKLN
jgi:hypothetical protein